MYYHVSLDSNHRISIPHQIRKIINLKKGDSLVMTVVNNEIHLNSIDTKIAEAQKLVKEYCDDKDLVEDLLTIRKEETLIDTEKEVIQELQSNQQDTQYDK